MKQFSLTDLNRSPGAVVEAAHRGPVELTGRGKRKFVILSADDYDRIINQPHRAFHIGSMTPAELDFFYEGLDGEPSGEA